ncbi:MAG: hypothetical protein WC862_03605 [Patescibacteria group bacterium]
MVNIKRALGFGVLLWVFIFVIWSVIMFVPVLKGRLAVQYVIELAVMIPLVLLLAKWYFKQDPPSVKKGLLLGILSLFVMAVLDLTITLPLFVGPQAGGYTAGLKQFYGSWQMWVSFAWFLILCVFAGWEFDRTFTKNSATKSAEKKLE